MVWSRSCHGAEYVVIPVLAAVCVWYVVGPDPESMICSDDHVKEQHVCRPKCQYGYFSLPWMDECQKWLRCKDIDQEIKVTGHVGTIGSGAIKVVYLGHWKEHNVAYNILLTPKYKKDFRHGLWMLRDLQPFPYVTQFLGYCKDSFITEYHPLGNAYQFINSLQEPRYLKHNTLSLRFQFCIDYAKIIQFLHNSPLGTRVMCDSNDIKKTLSQYLVTSDLSLVANDLDALPKVNTSNGELIKCGPRQLFGDFVAPEQLWPYEDQEFDDRIMPAYDEKTDIWKIPNVCEYFLGNIRGSDTLKFHLFKIHKQCKNTNPLERPSAADITAEYLKIKEYFDFG